jgi:hypothetical protein
MHYPCLDTDICKGCEVCLHQVGEDSFSLVVVEFMVCESNIGSAMPPSSLSIDGAKGYIPAIIVRMKARNDVSIMTTTCLIKGLMKTFTLTLIRLTAVVSKLGTWQQGSDEPLTKIFILRVARLPTHILIKLCPNTLEVGIAFHYWRCAYESSDAK